MAKRLVGHRLCNRSPLSIALLAVRLARLAEDMLDSIRALEFYCGIGKVGGHIISFHIANIWNRWTALRSFKEQLREQRDCCPRF